MAGPVDRAGAVDGSPPVDGPAAQPAAAGTKQNRIAAIQADLMDAIGGLAYPST